MVPPLEHVSGSSPDALGRIAGFVLALAIALAVLSAPAVIRAPFGVDPFETALGIGAFALGCILAPSASSGRGAAFTAALAFAGMIGVIRALASSVLPWVAATWPLPTVAPGDWVVAPPWPGGLMLASLLGPLGYFAARAWSKLTGGRFGVFALVGAWSGLLLVPLFTWRMIGPHGTLVVAAVLALVAAVFRILAGEFEVRLATSRWSWTIAIASGIQLGLVQIPLETGAGGTLFAVTFAGLLATSGALVGALARPLLSRAPRSLRIGAAIGLCGVALSIGRFMPSAVEVARASAAVAERSGGILPSFDLLYPLPLLLALAAFFSFLLGVFDSSRGIGVVLFCASIVRCLPRSHDALPWLGLLAVAFVVGGASENSIRRVPRFSKLASITLAALVLLVVIRLGTHTLHGSFERDGASLRSIEVIAADGVETVTALDGVPMPLWSTRQQSAQRLTEACLAWGDEPELCLVLGPGGAPWVTQLLRLSIGRVDYVTPYATEAREIDRVAAGETRLRVFVVPPRRFLAATHETYDRILLAPPEAPWHRAGTTLTTEFRALAIARLTTNGLAVQIFGLTSMQPSNLVTRFMGEAFLAVDDGVLIVDHPRSADPHLGLLFGRRPVRFDVDLARRRSSAIASRVSSHPSSARGARGLLASVIGDTSVLRFSSRVGVRNADVRPWLAASLHARVIPDPRYLPENLAGFVGYHAWIEARIDGPSRNRERFLDDARRDHEAVHHGLIRRAGGLADFRTDADEPTTSPLEIETLLQCLAKSPSSPMFCEPVLAAALELDSKDRAAARWLLDRAAAIESDFAKSEGEVEGATKSCNFQVARATMYARHGRKNSAMSQLDPLCAASRIDPRARAELGILLAYGGRKDRARAREILGAMEHSESSLAESSPEDRVAIARKWITQRKNSDGSVPHDAAARYRALPRRK